MILGRQQHPEMNALIESMKIHSEAPSTFDGEHPEFVFDRQAGEVSWLVGNQYLVPGPDNVEVMATLQSATVSPQGETMHGVFQTSGVNFVVNAPMTDAELAASGEARRPSLALCSTSAATQKVHSNWRSSFTKATRTRRGTGYSNC